MVPDGETLQDWDQPQADLVVDPAELRAMGQDARALSRILTVGSQASGATYTAAASLTGDGFTTGAALQNTMARFFRQSKNLYDDCMRIAEHLDDTGTVHVALEAEIETELRAATQALGPRGTPSILALAEESPPPTEIAGMWGQDGSDARI
ncbi:hypothetical protein ACFV5N_24295 [Streptomyces sp. NPDC059853]|uniref:hypothetical protein n=1 Tax=Streptomyces sp. NPDC059853 TaxID=3346973 RepID=UPI003649DD98